MKWLSKTHVVGSGINFFKHLVTSCLPIKKSDLYSGIFQSAIGIRSKRQPKPQNVTWNLLEKEIWIYSTGIRTKPDIEISWTAKSAKVRVC